MLKIGEKPAEVPRDGDLGPGLGEWRPLGANDGNGEKKRLGCEANDEEGGLWRRLEGETIDACRMHAVREFFFVARFC
jgi:hypothetical protein